MSVIGGSLSVGDLPVELTSFVGRRQELAEVKRALSARLVTITGPGGVGKTRVAIRAAGELRRSYEDGVWLAELADVRDPELLVQTVAGVFEAREQSATSPIATLVESLRSRRLLLILDNCEHLLQACTDLCRSLLEACPQLRILATSREPLDVDGEAVVALGPLEVPDVDALPSGYDVLTRYDAISLFLDRAATAVPGFRLSEDNWRAVAGICRQVDGLPLAIELAAVRLRALPADRILGRLTDRYRLLTGGMRAVPARQQTLRASIEWSYDLCAEVEQLLWARLGVFLGGFQDDAAQGVCADDRIPRDRIPELLASLADKSVLVREECGGFGMRYRMLETIREFAVQTLTASGERAELARRHRDWYLGLVEAAAAEWIGPRQEYWLIRMEREHPNVRAALEFSLVGPHKAGPEGAGPEGAGPEGADAALRLLVVPWRIYWWALGLISEGRRSADRALALGAGPVPLRARAHTLASITAVYQGEYELGRAHLDDALRLAEESQDPVARSYAVFARGMYQTYTADLPGSIATFEAGLAVAGPLPDVAWRLDQLMPLSVNYSLMGQPEKAIACHEESLALTAPRGESFHRSYALWALGLAHWQRGELEEAAALEREGLRLKRAVHDWLGVAFCLEALASIAASGQQDEQAATLLGAAETYWRATGSSPAAAQHLARFHEECQRRARAALGEDAYQIAFTVGRNMSADEVFAYALQEEPTGQAPPSWALLTRRQRQVAELVARGLSNREIAETLVISRRTAEGHVDKLRKALGLTSRAQMAAWFIGHHQV